MASSKEGYTIVNLHNFKEKKVACLTLDVERDYGNLLDKPSYEALLHIGALVDFLRNRDIPLTCFVQGSIFETHPSELEKFTALDIEFELHSYSHSSPREIDMELEVRKGKEAYKRFLAKDPIGYRSPRGVIDKKDYKILASHGFRFDSSIFPSLRPGVFNNLRKPTEPYVLNNHQMIEFPFSVFSKVIRIPIALSYIKLLGGPYLYFLKTFNLPKLIVFDFHLHDVFPLNSSNEIHLKKLSPIYRKTLKRIYQDKKHGLAILDQFTAMLQRKGYTFSKLVDVYEAISK